MRFSGSDCQHICRHRARTFG